MFFVLLKMGLIYIYGTQEFILIIKYKVKCDKIKYFLYPVLNFEKK